MISPGEDVSPLKPWEIVVILLLAIPCAYLLFLAMGGRHAGWEGMTPSHREKPDVAAEQADDGLF